MIGKLVEIHPDDAWSETTNLLGQKFDITNLDVWSELNNTVRPEIHGYFYGSSTYLGETIKQFDNGEDLETLEEVYFLAAKFEILENDEVK